YPQPDPDTIARSHHNLATYLARAGTDPVGRLAHRLAAGVLYQVTGQAHELAGTVRELARDLHDLPDAAPPATIPEVAAVVEQVDGVRFTTLVTALAGDLDTAQHALHHRAPGRPQPVPRSSIRPATPPGRVGTEVGRAGR